MHFIIWQFSSVQSLSRVRLFATPWTTAHQASLSNTNSQSLPKLMSIESVMPSSHLIFCRCLLLLPSIFPSIRVFSNESALLIRWPKYWSFSFNISPSSEHSGLISFRMDWLDLLTQYIYIYIILCLKKAFGIWSEGHDKVCSGLNNSHSKIWSPNGWNLLSYLERGFLQV